MRAGFGRAGPPLRRAGRRYAIPVRSSAWCGAARAADVDAARSRNAGTYLCNYVYWRGLEAARAPGGPGIVAFVHVPPIPLKARPAGRRQRSYQLADLVRAGEAILLAMTALARARGTATLVPCKRP